MNEITLLAALAGSYIVLIISPGPNFVVITQIAINQSRVRGIYTGIGVATGSITWALLAATGLGLMFQKAPGLQPALQLIGGLYLAYIGMSTLYNAGSQPSSRDPDDFGIDSLGKAYRFGLITNLTNPKALAFYTSVFSAVTQPSLPMWVRFAGVGIVGVLAMSWFVLLATLFSAPHIQKRYRAAKYGIDLVTGTVMIAFGVELLILLVPALRP